MVKWLPKTSESARSGQAFLSRCQSKSLTLWASVRAKIRILALNFKLSKFYNYKSNLNSCIWMHINCIYASLLRSIIRWKIIKAGLSWLQNVPKCLCFWWDWSRHWSIFSSLLLLVSFIGKMDFVLLWVTFSTDTSS